MRNPSAPSAFAPIRTDPGPWSVAEIRRAPTQGFQRLLGLELGEVRPDVVSAVVRIGPGHLNSVGFVHGGVLLALADSLGAMGALQHLAAGQRTATLESKANFIRPAGGPLLSARCTPLHVGRRTSVWTTTLESGSQMVASVTQTQLHFSDEPA
jgi:uncharacterized protein (TIGR00369 family)